MIITVQCPSCSTSFPVDPEKVPEGGVYARCSECAGVFFVERDHAPAETALELGTPSSAEAAPADASADRDVPAEIPPQDAFTDLDRPLKSASDDAFTGLDLAAESASDDAFTGLDLAVESASDDASTGLDLPVESAADDAFTGLDLPMESPAEDAFAELDLPGEAPPAEQAVDAGSSGPEPIEVAGGAAAAGVRPPEPEAGEDLSAPAPAFSFGRRDPHEKARRLARVLVSDMIMYNPERHSRAIESGSLREDFEDEIRKSWQEYVEQVGEELAKGTPYFDEALNDILARGEQVFP